MTYRTNNNRFAFAVLAIFFVTWTTPALVGSTQDKQERNG